jgi:UDP-3-O-[3-hydroxymyristoyl] glucosamine N-acyltransferase
MSQRQPKSACLSELAGLFGGTVVGDANVVVSRLMPTHLAGEGDITFVVSPKYLSMLEGSAASAVIVHPDFGYDGNIPRIETDNPYLAFARVQTLLAVSHPESKGVSEAATVAASAEIGADVTISPGCFVGENVKVGTGSYLYPGVVLYDNVQVGEDCQLHSGVVIREECRIGHRVLLHANVVIGADGFGFAPDGEKYCKIPQIGNVVLEDDVEIGACSCVDRAAMGTTLVKQGCKIDNLVQIAHNVQVGENTIMVAQTGIAGSAVIGKHCTFGGQSGSVGHIKVGDNVTVVARGTTTADTESHQMVAGFPMMPHKEWLKSSAGFAKLPEVRKEISRLQKKIKELERRMEES